MNEKLAQVCFEAFHHAWEQYNPSHEHLSFDETSSHNKNAWDKVGHAALDWFLDATFEVDTNEG